MNKPKVLDASDLKEVKFQLVQADVPTANGLVYPAKVMQRAVRNYKQKIDVSAAVGEFWDANCPTGSTTVDLRLATHRIKTLDFDEKTGMTTGTAHVLRGTKHGKELARSLQEETARPVMHGLGTANKESNVVEDFEFISINFCPTL